jgi:NAD(P)H-flavin reductase
MHYGAILSPAVQAATANAAARANAAPRAVVPGLDPMVPRPYRIERVRAEVADVFSWHLKPLDNLASHILPGQFNMLYAPGIGEVAISVSGDCRDHTTLVHTIRAVGTVTKAMASLRAGAMVGVRGPFGSAWPIEAGYGKDVVFITGTVGLAPLRPLIYEVLNRREKYGKVIITYGSRGTDDILYERDLHTWRGRFDIDVNVTVHSAPSGYRGRVGSVAAAVKLSTFEGGNAVAFVCRSEALTLAAVLALQDRGLTTDRIYTTLERNMKCGIGFCGHCQFGPTFMCKEGPVYRFDSVERIFSIREL